MRSAGMDSQLRIEVDLGPASSHTSPDLVAVGTACSNAPGAESLHAARVNHELARLVATGRAGWCVTFLSFRGRPNSWSIWPRLRGRAFPIAAHQSESRTVSLRYVGSRLFRSSWFRSPPAPSAHAIARSPVPAFCRSSASPKGHRCCSIALDAWRSSTSRHALGSVAREDS